MWVLLVMYMGASTPTTLGEFKTYEECSKKLAIQLQRDTDDGKQVIMQCKQK